MLSRSLSRLFSTGANRKIAVMFLYLAYGVMISLSGCGVFDGSEISESVFVLESISRCNVKYQCYAPNIEQMHVINHLTGDPVEETRNVLVESARIARSNVLDLSSLKPEEYNAVILPGGFGVAKNLSDFGSEGPNMTVIEPLASILKSFNEAKKPIGMCCIAPIVAARLFPNVRVTMGQETVGEQYPYADACGAVKAMGAIHVPMGATDICVDDELRIVTSPAYMHNGPIHMVHDSIDNMVKKVIEMI